MKSETGPITSENVEARSSLPVEPVYSSEETGTNQNLFGVSKLSVDRPSKSAEHVSDHQRWLIDEELDTEPIHVVSTGDCCLSCIAQSRLRYLDLAVYPDHDDTGDELYVESINICYT